MPTSATRHAALLAALCLAHASARHADAQPTPLARHSVFAEVLGNAAGPLSLNYDRRLGAGRASVRVGVAGWETSCSGGGGFLGCDEESSSSYWTVPLLLNALTGAGTHHLEFGAGVLGAHRSFTRAARGTTESSTALVLTGTVGYRRQRPGRGLVLRVTATPSYGFGGAGAAYPGDGLLMLAGLGLGYSF